MQLTREPDLRLPLADSLERWRLRIYGIMILADAVAIIIGFSIASALLISDWNYGRALRHASYLIPLYWTAAVTLRGYGIRALTDLNFASTRALAALLWGEVVLLFAAFAINTAGTYSHASFALGIAIAALLLFAVRRLVQRMVRKRCGGTAMNVLVINDGGPACELPHAFTIDAARHGLLPDLSDPVLMHRLGLCMMNMDRVVVSCPPERRAAWALVLKSSNTSGTIADEEVSRLGVLGTWLINGFGSLVVSLGPLGLRGRVLKRAFDLSLSGLALLVLTPLLLLVAILIKLEDGGPILFVQQRTGQGNRFFRIYKFRSMRVERQDAAGTRSASINDDRVTRIGRFIRRTSIDELPQLINVLLGDMSIVGPRPHAIGSLAGDKLFWDVDQRYWLRHALKPGLTGLAQVRGWRGATDTEQALLGRLQSDLEYLDGWTIWRDIRIVFQTMTVLMHDRAF